MDELNKVLGQVPQVIKERGSAVAKLEALWRVMAYSRNGIQTRVAGDLAERWAGRQQRPRLSPDDPRQAAKRLEKCLTGETTLPLDLALDFIEVLPEPFRAAARVLLFPRQQPGEGELLDALNLDAEHDAATDQLRYRLARGDADGMVPEELEAAAQAFDEDCGSCRDVAKALRVLAEKRRRIAA